MTLWSRTFLIGAAAGLTAIVVLSRVAVDSGRREIVARATRLPMNWVVPRVTTAAQAKRKGLFWVTRAGDPPGLGLAVRMLSQPELFDSVFPGYSKARFDTELWEDYLSHTFDLRARTPTLEALIGDSQIALSWMGNLKIFRHYGSDILIFGNSETFFSLRPSQLAEMSGIARARVLFAAKPGMMPVTMLETANALAGSGHRAHVSILGYSIWGAYSGAINRAAIEEAHEILAAQFSKEGPAKRPAPTALSWDTVIPQRFNSLLDPVGKWKQGRVDSFDFLLAGGTLRFPRSALSRPEHLQIMAKSMDFSRGHFGGIKPSDCRLSTASAELDAVLTAILRISHRVVLFVPPTVPFPMRGVPACFLPAVRRMLASKASPDVIVETGDLRSYKMDYSDFITETIDPVELRLDINHPNSAASLKVTAKIGRLVRKALDKGLPEGSTR